MQNITTVKELSAVLRQGKFTSFGTYPLYLVSADYEVLSFEAVLENIKQVFRAMKEPGTNKQWQIVGVEVNWENPDLYCDHTSEPIGAAYA